MPSDVITFATELRDAGFERLQKIKAQYDPGNLFRFNHNIPPASA